MKISAYLFDKTGVLVLNVTGFLLLSVFLYFTGSTFDTIVIIFLFWMMILITYIILDYRKQRKKLDEAWSILENLPQKYLLMECIPKPYSEHDRQWHEMMCLASRAMTESVSQATQQQIEYREYVENWVHEIKAPITSIQLICENNKSDITNRILSQLISIEDHVERSLFYARSEHMDRDLFVSEVSLNDIVDSAISKHRFLLIQNDMNINTRNLDLLVQTDKKLLEFIVSQIITNSMEYKHAQPLLSIVGVEEEDTILLQISDNGIGIPSAELSRVFDKGFVGSNGRKTKSSTGMGLYLSKKVADQIGIAINLESVVGASTTFTLRFPNPNQSLLNLTKL